MSYTVRAIYNGECQVAGHHTYYQGNPEERRPFPLLVWLIEGADGPLLIDTGLYNVDEMNQGAAHVLAEPITQQPEHEIRVQLEKYGYRPEDIHHVFITHLHFDHVDQLDLYTNARIVVSKRGLEEALASEQSWAPSKTLELLSQTARDRTLAVDDDEVLPGIEVVWVGGHSPCSQVVYVRTSQGDVAFPGDAIFRVDQLESKIPIGIFHDLDQARVSIDTLNDREAIVLPSHDPAVFERFPEGVIG